MKPLTTIIPARAILTKRPCKHCNKEIYLQFMKITPKLQCWVCFDSSDGKLHDCPAKPLAFEVKQLIETAINQISPSTDSNNIHTQNITNTGIIHRIDRIIEDLDFIRQSIIMGQKRRVR